MTEANGGSTEIIEPHTTQLTNSSQDYKLGTITRPYRFENPPRFGLFSFWQEKKAFPSDPGFNRH
jgi:hypothetical protein